MSYDTKLTIYQRLHATMRAVGYVQKDTEIPGAKNNKGVARDAVVAKIRGALLDNGVIAHTTQIDGRYLETTRKSSSGTPLSIYVGKYATHFVNVDSPPDKPEEVIVQHEAQGDDYGDKAPGKAATYAEKLNLVKGLMLETGLDDEGRNPGDGDDGAGDKTGKDSAKVTGNIKPPASKSAKEKPVAEPDTTPASPGLLKQIKAAAEAKGLTDVVTKNLAAKGGHTLDAMPKSVATAIWKWIGEQAERQREPGEEG